MTRIRLMLIGAGGAVLALVVLALSGVLNVAATSRPFAVTEWFWHALVRQSVTLHSVGIDVPPLDDAAMVRRAAGHYELVCATCHGSPSRPPAGFARHLLPQPPLLVRQMERWRPPARVFWTVKHGIRHTAMPAWPDQQREDEVWDMVAFIRAMPELTEDAYRTLSGYGEAEVCARCHGTAGEGGGGGLPRLDIQSPAYLASALRAFREGTRSSGIMRSVAAGLDDTAIDAFAGRYGRGPEAPGDAPDEGRGAEIAHRGIPDRKIPACEQCHGADARPDYPRLAGQDEAYIANQLRLFVTLGAGRGGPRAAMMATAAWGLTEADIAAVAVWYAARPPTPR
jgi:cytochrome c553